MITEITYKDFSNLGAELGWTVDMLAERFAETIDRPAEYFERVMSCRWKNPNTGRYEDRSGVVIAFKSVLRFYVTELKGWQERTGSKAPLSPAQMERNRRAGVKSRAPKRAT